MGREKSRVADAGERVGQRPGGGKWCRGEKGENTRDKREQTASVLTGARMGHGAVSGGRTLPGSRREMIGEVAVIAKGPL